MTTRLWHQSVNELSRIAAYKEGIEAHARAFLGPEVEIHVQGLAEGTYGDLSPSDAHGNAS